MFFSVSVQQVGILGQGNLLLMHMEAALTATMATMIPHPPSKQYLEVGYQRQSIGLQPDLVSLRLMETTVVQTHLWKCPN